MKGAILFRKVRAELATEESAEMMQATTMAILAQNLAERMVQAAAGAEELTRIQTEVMADSMGLVAAVQTGTPDQAVQEQMD